MSKKHIDEYFGQVFKDYRNMLDTLKTLEKECQEGLVEPERIEQFKANILPLMNNYERVLYIKFLYDMPNRKEKVATYKRNNKKFLESIKKENMSEETLKENQEVLKVIKKSVKG